MSDSQKLGKASDLCSEIKYGISALDAIQAAMSGGPDDPESFTDGLYCVLDYLSGKVNALSRLLNDEGVA